MNSKNIEEYDFDNPNRISISASFGISSNQAKTISTTVSVPIKQTKSLSKAVAIPFKKAKPITSLNTIISNLEKLAVDFGINIQHNKNIVSLEDINLEDIEKLLEFANDSIFTMQGTNLKEAYFKFQNSDGTYTHKSFIVDTVKISDEAIVAPHSNSPTISTTYLQKLLPAVFALLTLFSTSEFGKIAKDISLDIIISILYDYGLKPYIEEKKYETDNIIDLSKKETLDKFFINKRVVKNPTDLFEHPKLKSSIIENLPSSTLLTVLPDKTIPKSWLKVKITLNQNEVEGYVLRRNTSTVR
ncbi:hypothetical protein E0H80_02000 [Acinetobacter sp. ANC 4779]|uniref:hypothetical protein n=1 Tax=Acinetobacter sp. ANC 4779 TaxID=2529848 RepID=UPI00103E4161|nr:hypothetical protein [Acinetobacter sp. ANC 4779]TCB52635.1 hypothetical protein E0H80_02000 [Acinetobacter sp. ANC 4779]